MKRIPAIERDIASSNEPGPKDKVVRQGRSVNDMRKERNTGQNKLLCGIERVFSDRENSKTRKI